MFRDLVDDLDDHSPKPAKLLDVPFVPSDDRVIEAMLKLANIGPDDVLYDLGCGDGRIVITAARSYGIRAIGVELDPLRVADAMEAAADARVEFIVDFIEESIFTVDFSEATVVTLYLLETVNQQLRPRLLKELRPGSRIISHAFNMGDWKADEELELSGITLYKWVVPAKVAGNWEWEASDGTPYHLELEQAYQEVSGTVWQGDQLAQLKSATLRGAELEVAIQGKADTALKRFILTFEDPEQPSVLELD